MSSFPFDLIQFERDVLCSFCFFFRCLCLYISHSSFVIFCHTFSTKMATQSNTAMMMIFLLSHNGFFFFSSFGYIWCDAFTRSSSNGWWLSLFSYRSSWKIGPISTYILLVFVVCCCCWLFFCCAHPPCHPCLILWLSLCAPISSVHFFFSFLDAAFAHIGTQTITHLNKLWARS